MLKSGWLTKGLAGDRGLAVDRLAFERGLAVERGLIERGLVVNVDVGMPSVYALDPALGRSAWMPRSRAKPVLTTLHRSGLECREYGQWMSKVELLAYHAARQTPMAAKLLEINKSQIEKERSNVEEDYHEVDEWLHQEVDQCEHIDLDQSLCVAVEHDKWDEAVVDLKDSMISTIHEVVPEEKLAEADDKINTMFKRLKFTKSTKQGIDLVDLNFEREGLQLMAGWAVVYWKDEKHKYFAFAQAGCAWQNNEAYALRSGSMCNNKILGKAGNWLKYKSMGNLLVSLGDKTITDAACS